MLHGVGDTKMKRLGIVGIVVLCILPVISFCGGCIIGHIPQSTTDAKVYPVKQSFEDYASFELYRRSNDAANRTTVNLDGLETNYVLQEKSNISYFVSGKTSGEDCSSICPMISVNSCGYEIHSFVTEERIDSSKTDILSFTYRVLFCEIDSEPTDGIELRKNNEKYEVISAESEIIATCMLNISSIAVVDESAYNRLLHDYSAEFIDRIKKSYQTFANVIFERFKLEATK